MEEILDTFVLDAVFYTYDILCPICYILYAILYTICYVYAICYMLYAMCCVLCAVCYGLSTMYYVLCTMHYVLCTVRCVLHTLHIVHSAMHYPLHTTYYKLHATRRVCPQSFHIHAPGLARRCEEKEEHLKKIAFGAPRRLLPFLTFQEHQTVSQNLDWSF